jgi:hypothetical protein
MLDATPERGEGALRFLDRREHISLPNALDLTCDRNSVCLVSDAEDREKNHQLEICEVLASH